MSRLSSLSAGLAAAFVLAPVIAFAADGATQAVDNPYGLDALWAQGDFVARATLVILVLMSVSTWYILLGKAVEQSRLLRQARSARQTFRAGKTVEDSIAPLPKGSPFQQVATAGLEALKSHHGALGERVDLHTWTATAIQRATDAVAGRLQGGLAVLATVGSTAPFIGLFGTVWGIYHALTAIGIAGQASIDKVAGPVGEALIMTAIGLFVAVPAVLGYNFLVRRNKAALDHLRAFAADLHALTLGASVRTADSEPVSHAATILAPHSAATQGA